MENVIKSQILEGQGQIFDSKIYECYANLLILIVFSLKEKHMKIETKCENL